MAGAVQRLPSWNTTEMTHVGGGIAASPQGGEKRSSAGGLRRTMPVTPARREGAEAVGSAKGAAAFPAKEFDRAVGGVVPGSACS